MERERTRSVRANFLLFLLGRMVSDIGNSVQMMVMPLYILDIGGSAATIGIFAFLSLIPTLIIYPFAGVIGDRLNRKMIMVVTDLLSAAIIILLGVASYQGLMKIPLLLIVQTMISLLNGLFEPATRGMLPRLVERKELTRRNSIVASLRSISIMVGPVIGTALYANFGITLVFMINGISFFLSGVSEMMIKYAHIQRNKNEVSQGIIKDLLEGLHFIIKNRIIRNLCYFFFAIYFVVQPIFGVILPVFFKKELNYSDTYYGYLQAIIILGAVIGSVLVGIYFGKEDKPLKPLRIGSGLLIGTMLMLFTLLSPKSLELLGNDSLQYLALLAGTLGVFSLANIFISVPAQTYIQRETPDEYMSRVLSLVSMISRGGMPLGAVVFGIILELIGIPRTVWLATLAMILICIVFFKKQKNNWRK